MKRRLVTLAALAAILLSTSAHAGHWVNKEVQWQLSNVGAPFNSTAIYVRDTLYNVLATGQADTTGTFSLNEADQSLGTVAGAAVTESASQADTLVMGYLVIQPDSTAAGTATLSNVVVLIDGQAGSPGFSTNLSEGWVKADSANVTIITGDKSVGVPIKSISPYGNVMRWATLRARITSATGVLSGGVRAWLRYWDAEK